jgi:hypothetical protein
MGKNYAYIATSLIYVFVFFAVIFGIFGLFLTLCLCRPKIEENPADVSRMGCCMTQTSWCSSSCSIVLLAFLGIIFYILSIAIGDTCYTIDNIPKVGFNAYFGKIIPPMGGMEPVKIMDACWQGKDVLPILGIEVPKNVSGSFDTSKIDSLNLDFKIDGWDTYTASIEKAGAADTKAAVKDINDKISEITTAGVKLQTGVPATVNTAFTSVDAALTAATAAVSDCGFIADIYRSFSSALCQDGLEGLLWMTLATLIVAWCCFPMIITSILINIRTSGLGQKGTIIRGSIAPRPGTEGGSRMAATGNLST